MFICSVSSLKFLTILFSNITMINKINLIYIFSVLTESLIKVKPDFIIYNAGTDILKGDRLGLLSITPQVSCDFIIL